METVALDSSLDEQELAEFVARLFDRAAIPGLAVAVVQGDRVILDATHGYASLELNVPATARTIFPIASITKVFTATLVMQLVQEGHLTLDAPIGVVLSDLPAEWQPVTLRQMLAHMSGLPDVIENPLTGQWLAETREAALLGAATLPMQFSPGSAWSYNQTNYVLLGAAVERVTGRLLSERLEETILSPLGLSKTTYADARVVLHDRGPWYTRIDFSGPEPRLADDVHPTWVTYPEFAHPCAALNTTAAELARFVAAVAAGVVLRPGTVVTMWAPQMLSDGQPAGPDQSSIMSLGWIVEQLGDRKLVGGSGGATAAFRHAVDERMTVVVLTNCQGSNPDGIALEVLARVLG